jgi:ribA/ribD-fused uncharacterized protein
MTEIPKIDRFRERYHFLSNMYPCPVKIEGIQYPTSENAYQALKYNDLKMRLFIADMTPKQAKQFAKENQIADLTDIDRLSIMYRVLSMKFMGNNEMLRMLLDTGNAELVEGNDWKGTFWGVCNGVGDNHLGKMLMSMRNNFIANIMPFVTSVKQTITVKEGTPTPGHPVIANIEEGDQNADTADS